MKKTLVIACTAIVLAVVGYKPAVGQQQAAKAAAPAALAPAAQRAMVDQYCVKCHSDKVKSAGLSLEKVDFTHIGDNAEVGEKIVRKLRSGMMPPLGQPRPALAQYEGFVAGIENELDKAAANKPYLVAPGVHRVNRAEYANSVRELTGLVIDPGSYLPVDDSASGFDNVAGSLGISPALVESYMSAAGKVARMALGHELTPSQKNYIPAPDYSQDDHVEGLPFGTRGGIFIQHYFPADGEYSINWAPVRSNTGVLLGQNKKGEQLEVAIDGVRAKLFDVDKEITGTTYDDNHEVRIPVKAGLRTVEVSFLDSNKIPIDDLNQHPIRTTLETGNVGGYTMSPQIGSVTISGPYNGKIPTDTPSRKKIMMCTPATQADEVPCAKKILATLARQAYRRPANDGDVEGLLTFFQAGRNKGDFEKGIETALQAILSDPEFVFRGESDPAGVKPGQAYRISDTELASRLAFFMWSAPPDDELITLASQNKLHDPKVLEAQTRRLLADPRAHQMMVNFAGQWLQLRNLASSAPLGSAFPDFDDNLRQAYKTEVEMWFEDLVRGDHSVPELMNSDYTFINERLAKAYGIPNIYGSQFRKITIPKDFDVRRGILGKGAIELVTALADRTSPVQRGKWILMNVLGLIPPEPPPNVPPLKESDKKANGATVPLQVSMRERMEEHRANPICASCHTKMDPLGFALEAFDAIGAYRTTEFGKTMNVEGQLTDGRKVQGPSGLRDALMTYSPQFVRMFTEKMLVYALGRNVDYGDMPVMRTIVRDAAKTNYKFSSIIVGVVKSQPFQMNVKAADKSTVAMK